MHAVLAYLSGASSFGSQRRCKHVHIAALQVAQELGDSVHILKVDTEIEKALASQLRIQGLPTMIFIGMDPEKPALRTEGLLPANSIKDIVLNELIDPAAPAETGA